MKNELTVEKAAQYYPEIGEKVMIIPNFHDRSAYAATVYSNLHKKDYDGEYYLVYIECACWWLGRKTRVYGKAYLKDIHPLPADYKQ